MTEQPKIRKECYYRVNSPLAIRASGEWIPAGVIADLSDCQDAFLTWALKSGMIETADPTEDEPLYNSAIGAVDRPPCPCNK